MKCLAGQVIVFSSDSRGNAGVAIVSTLCKTKRWEVPKDRWIGSLRSACTGHLGVSQEVYAKLYAEAASGMSPN